jgi:L-phenylalanine/L-methionine N-acetyltransferase
MIRNANNSDFNFIKSLYFHPDINPFLLYEMDEIDNFETIFQKLLAADILYVFENEGIMKGMCKIGPFQHRTSHIVYLGGVAIDPNHVGKGLGQTMVLEILDLAKAKGYHRIELSTASFNEKALYLYEKVGFVKEGVLRDYTFLKSENRYIDEVLMSCLV